jgi:hypothetical protein
MSKDKFIEFCIEYVPYKECVERYVGDGVLSTAAFFVILIIATLIIGGIWETANR